jgi:hypothetical protein
MFEDGKKSALLHVPATVYWHGNGFVGSRVEIELVRAFGALENKAVLFQDFDQVFWA